MSKMVVGRRNLAELKLDPANARTHDARNLGAIRSSFERFGQVEPIVVQKSTGRVIGGNGRVAVLREMGATEADVVEVDVDDLNATALGIALNRTAELAGWDEDVLGKLLGEMRDEGLSDVLAFSDREIDALLGPAAGLSDPDEIPPVPAEPVTKPGDLYVLGERGHRLLCGDSTSASDVAKLLDGAKPELMVTDGPYGVSLDMEWRDRAGLNSLAPAEPSYMQRTDGHRNTAISGDTKADWSDAYELVPSLRVVYCWHASAFTIEVGQGLRRIGFDLRQMIVWRKPHFVLSRTHYHYQSEPCWYAVRKGATAKWVGSRDQSNVWDAASPKQLMAGSTEEKQDHPTQKPLLCMERPVENHDFADVYEPFAGSGTTVVACERQRRRCFAMEIDPKFCDLVVARFEKFSGTKAARVSA
jgi:DNA modification methylase